ncbi:MAG: hypothetical protein R3C53_10590 [Pirellulaceae bacterium]
MGRLSNLFWATALGLAAMQQTVDAGLITYTDQSSFAAATAGLTFASQDFSSATSGALSKNTAHDFGGFSATAVDNTTGSNNMVFYIAPASFSGAQYSPFTNSQHLGWAEDPPGIGNGSGQYGPTVTIQFDAPQTAVSFLFLDSDVTDEYRLSVDGVNVAFPSNSSSFRGAFFFGLINSTDSISTLVFSADNTSPGGVVEEFGIDDLRFSLANTVPEPMSVTIWSLGILGLASGTRRRRS